MNTPLKKRLIRTFILALIAFAVGGSFALMQIKKDRASSVQKEGRDIAMPGVKIGGDFALINHHGEAVTQDAYAGRYKLVYFGFTYCPAICPTELQKISKVIGNLDEERAAQIQPLFITIDPERDTVETMQAYVDLFDPRLEGLTGTPEQIEPVLKNYRVFATKVPTEDPSSLNGFDETSGDDYTMDHSSFIYLMSPENDLISMYRIQDDADYIIKDITAKL